MSTISHKPLLIACGLIGMPCCSADLQASGTMTTPPTPAYSQECGSCHLAYPARWLSAASWQAVLDGLSRHFGSDASLDEQSLTEISRYLESHAGHRQTVAADGQPLLRITETRWFRHEHDEVPPSTWKLPAVKSPANCAACHTGAEQNRYSEHDRRLPQ